MSWISDVAHELRKLKKTKKDLRKFGLLVGSVFIALCGLGMYRHWNSSLNEASGIVGSILFLGGALRPMWLAGVYSVWMGAAFAIGWLVSRVILVILFYLVITPIGLIARSMGKEFLEIGPDRKKNSYWIAKDRAKKINYEKLF